MLQIKPVLSTLINVVLWIPFILFIMPPTLVFWLYRKLLEVIAIKFLKKNFRLPNNSTDILWCQGDNHLLPNTNYLQVWLVSGEWITPEEFSSHFHTCFLEDNSEKYKNLYAQVTTYCGYSFYSHCKPDDLNLKWHIREYSLSDYGSNSTLESFVADWMTTNTYEKDRPAWQIAIVHLGGPENSTKETGIVAKFSHALVDGYSFIHMIGKMTGNPAPYIVPDKPISRVEKLKYVFQAPKDLLSMYAEVAFSKNSRSPFKIAKCSWNKTSSEAKQQEWLLSFTTLNLATVKVLRRATDSHFMCLLISAQIGALRRLMLETKLETELPEYLWTSCSLPWPSHPHSLTNHWALAMLKCPLKLANPLERVQFIERYYRKLKEDESDTKGYFVLLPFARALPTRIRRFLMHNDFTLVNVPLFLASLMLSSKTHYLLGRQVKKLWMPLALPDIIPVVLNGVATSHSGQIDLSISTCTTVVKSQEELDRLTQVYFKQELDSIASLCGLQDETAILCDKNYIN